MSIAALPSATLRTVQIWNQSVYLQLQLVLVERRSELVQRQELAKGVEAHELGQELQGALAHYGSLILQPACSTQACIQMQDCHVSHNRTVMYHIRKAIWVSLSFETVLSARLCCLRRCLTEVLCTAEALHACGHADTEKQATAAYLLQAGLHTPNGPDQVPSPQLDASMSAGFWLWCMRFDP